MENVTQAEEAEANLEATQEVAATPEEAEGAATATQANEKVETEMAEETEDATQTKDVPVTEEAAAGTNKKLSKNQKHRRREKVRKARKHAEYLKRREKRERGQACEAAPSVLPPSTSTEYRTSDEYVRQFYREVDSLPPQWHACLVWSCLTSFLRPHLARLGKAHCQIPQCAPQAPSLHMSTIVLETGVLKI